MRITALNSLTRYYSVNVIFRPYGRTISCPCAIFRPCDVASHVIESRDTRPHIQIVYRFSEAYTSTQAQIQ